MRRQPRILATRPEYSSQGVIKIRVELEAPPVAIVLPVESILGLWWFRAGGYPPGLQTGSRVDQ